MNSFNSTIKTKQHSPVGGILKAIFLSEKHGFQHLLKFMSEVLARLQAANRKGGQP